MIEIVYRTENGSLYQYTGEMSPHVRMKEGIYGLFSVEKAAVRVVYKKKFISYFPPKRCLTAIVKERKIEICNQLLLFVKGRSLDHYIKNDIPEDVANELFTSLYERLHTPV